MKDIVHILHSTLKTYKKVMLGYMKDTGGGPGEDEGFVSGKNRDSEMFSNAHVLGQNNIYLTIVHMWDKSVGFVITEVKDPIPSDFTIDETVGDNVNSIVTTPAANIDKESSTYVENNSKRKCTDFECEFLDVVRSFKDDFRDNKSKVEQQKYVIDVISKTKQEIIDFEESYEVTKNKKILVKGNVKKFNYYKE